ncbi:MAG: nucleotide sugar dehydrogenase [Gammaproteobacteria bacterium]|nr:nucleotide sugar dehydrogenase [Gammaproteobacteria bacterium]
MELVAVVGLGYVGLPLAVAFGRTRRTLGFDIDPRKLQAYRAGEDPTGEVGGGELRKAVHLEYSDDPAALREADLVVVAVPTPIDRAHQPDLGPVMAACRTVGRNLKPGAVVIFESTVYPGCTEEVCVPILERESGHAWSGRVGGEERDTERGTRSTFSVGYSPERVNPGDRVHRLESIVKVVSGDTPETLERVDALYRGIIAAGLHRAPSIRVAEAAKVIENTQRDLNIALMNELALIFDRLGIDTQEVLEAAGTKWNFLPFRPGLVGGHCIGVDPYYLTHKAETLGYHPQVILAGRRINDGMGAYIAGQAVKHLIRSGSCVKGARVNVLGLTFKEDCPDLRNSRVVDVIQELRDYGCAVAVHDPLADGEEARREYGLELTPWEALPKADALVLAVAHKAYRELAMEDYRNMLNGGGCLVDVKSIIDRSQAEAAGIHVWRL